MRLWRYYGGEKVKCVARVIIALKMHMIRIVCQMLRRITSEILGVKGFKIFNKYCAIPLV